MQFFAFSTGFCVAATVASFGQGEVGWMVFMAAIGAMNGVCWLALALERRDA